MMLKTFGKAFAITSGILTGYLATVIAARTIDETLRTIEHTTQRRSANATQRCCTIVEINGTPYVCDRPADGHQTGHWGHLLSEPPPK